VNTEPDTTDQHVEADEDIGKMFFASAVLARPGENIIDVVSRPLGQLVAGHDNLQSGR
jgi:hypothetical protein